MVQPATPAPNVAIVGSGPTGFIQPAIPYAFAFALGNAPVLNTRIPLGKVVTIAVADGRRAPHASHDWFATRVPVIPAETGPVSVSGVRRGDILEIEVIALEPDDPGSSGPLLVTVAIASGRTARDADPVQAAIPAGGAVRVTARQSGGLIVFGPVVARREREGDPGGEPVAAEMMVRCTVIQSQGV